MNVISPFQNLKRNVDLHKFHINTLSDAILNDDELPGALEFGDRVNYTPVKDSLTKCITMLRKRPYWKTYCQTNNITYPNDNIIARRFEQMNVTTEDGERHLVVAVNINSESMEEDFFPVTDEFSILSAFMRRLTPNGYRYSLEHHLSKDGADIADRWYTIHIEKSPASR